MCCGGCRGCVCTLRRSFRGEFGRVEIAKEREHGDEADEDGNGDGVPPGARGVKRTVNAQASVGGGVGSRSKIWQQVEWETAYDGADGGDSGGGDKFIEDFFGLAAIGEAVTGDGADFGRGELGELRGQRSRNGRSFPPGLEALGEVRGELVGVERGIGIAAGNVENAAGAALAVFPGDVDAFAGKKARQAIGESDGSDLVLAESKFGFFAAVAEAIGAEEKMKLA